jgi:uncharacterized membrane protein
MNQDEINEREHGDPANWSSPFEFYHSSLDSRLWVPKQQAWMGWTLNLAHPIARVLVLVFVLALCLVVAAVVYAVLPR